MAEEKRKRKLRPPRREAKSPGTLQDTAPRERDAATVQPELDPSSLQDARDFPLSQNRKEVTHMATIGNVLLRNLIREELASVLAPPASSLAPPGSSFGLLPPGRAAPPAGLRELIQAELASVLAPPASSLAPPGSAFGLLPPGRAAPPAGLRELIQAELASVLAPPASSLAPPGSAFGLLPPGRGCPTGRPSRVDPS